MTGFWIAAVALIIISLAVLILPLARKKEIEAAPGRKDFDLTVYKDQLKEIVRDQERGVLSEDQALAAQTEIERRMLAVADEKDSGLETAETRHPKSTMALVVAILIIVPLGTLGLYSFIGQPNLADQPLAQRQIETEKNAKIDDADRERARQLLAELEKRLEANPKDVQGWLILAQIYEGMDRHKDAAEVYAKVVELTDRHPQAVAALAEAMIMAEDTKVLPDAVTLLEEVKAKDPTDPRSYFYLALEHRQNEDLRGAMDEYVALLKVSPANAEWVEQIKSNVQVIAGELNIDMPQIDTLPPEQTAEVPGLTEEQVEGAQQMSPEDQQEMIRSMVQRLADRLEETPDDLAGWQRLAQAYRVLGDDEGLAKAQAQIERLSN